MAKREKRCEKLFHEANCLNFGLDGEERNLRMAVELYDRVIQENVHPEAMCELAFLLETGGDGVQADVKRSVELYERAAEHGHVCSMNRLALLLEAGDYGLKKDVKRAVELYERAVCEGEHVSSMYNLADLLEKGDEGVQADVKRSMELYERAVENGHVYSMNRLAHLYKTGEHGLERDVKRAMKLYERAICEGENVFAMYDLAYMLETGDEGVQADVKRSVELYERAVENGHVLSMNRLALMLEEGRDGLEKDVKRAVELYNRAIRENENVQAMYKLACILKMGREGVHADVTRSAKLFQCAVERGHVKSMAQLAVLLTKGKDGIQRNVKRALELCEHAIRKGTDLDEIRDTLYCLACMREQGEGGMTKNIISQNEFVDVMCYLFKLLENGEGVLINTRRAADLYEQIISQHEHVDAMYNLAKLLEKGEGVSKNTKRAANLYEHIISRHEHACAMYSLAKLLEKGEGVSKNTRRAADLYEQIINQKVHGDAMHNAMYNLAKLLEKGEGVSKNTRRAADLYEQIISRKEHAGAMYNLAKLLEKGEGVSRNFWRAVDLRIRAIESSDDESDMIKLGVAFWFGLFVVEKDARRAVQVLARVIDEKRSSAASRILAGLLRQGSNGVPKDVSGAIRVLENALTHSHGADREANGLNLARMLLSEESGILRDPCRARRILECSVANSFTPAYHELGALLSKGDTGVPREPERAAELLQASRLQTAPHSLCSGHGENHPLQSIFNAGSNYPAFVEGLLGEVRTNTRQCFVLVLGGAGRGKSSVVRSLKGQPFIEAHVPTEFAAVEHIGIFTGQRGLASSALQQLEFRTESLYSVMTRERQQPAGQITGDDTQLAYPKAVPTQFCQLERRETIPCGVKEQPNCRSRKEQDQRAGDFQGRSCSNSTDGPTVDKDSAQLQMKKSKARANETSGIEPLTFGVDMSRCIYDRVIEKVRMAFTEELAYREDTSSNLLRCWDFGGQTQYMMAHSLFIGAADILIFVVDLQRLMSKETREEELQELCRWMQLAYSLANDLHSLEPIIVGTRRDSCGDLDEARNVLLSGLQRKLGKGPFDDWVTKRQNGGSFKRRLQVIEIEKSKALHDAGESGLEELEFVLKSTANRIVMQREKVCARWIGLVEELERIETVFLTKEFVCKFVEKFPGFDKDSCVREKDALEALRYHARLGRVVLFEVGDSEYFVFMHPAEIVKFVRQVTGPEELIKERLGRNNQSLLEKGMVTREGLSILWGEHTRKVQDVMLDVLCRFDLLMRVQDSEAEKDTSEMLIGVPALLPSGWKGFEWDMEDGQSELVIETTFESAFPAGVAGGFIANLHRTLGKQKTLRTNLRSNAAILALRDACRAACIFEPEDRKIIWVLRGEGLIKIAHQCLRALELFVQGPLRQVRCGKKTSLIRTDCPKTESRNGCGGIGCVEFELPEEWIGSENYRELPNLEGECMDGKPWRLHSLLPFTKQMQFCHRAFTLPSPTLPYDVFISHAGSEKYSVAYPLLGALTTLGLRCFLDEESLCPSNKTNAAQIFAAIRGSRSGMFVLSPEFARRKWPMLELQEFIKRTGDEDEDKAPIVMPLFYGLSVEECSKYNLPQRGLPETTALLKQATSFVGVRNDRGESEADFAQRAAERLAEVLQASNGVKIGS